MSRAPPVVMPTSVLRIDWKILTRLASRWSKPLDHDACLASSSLYRFCDETNKLKPAWFWGTDQKIIVVILKTKSPNRSGRFWGPIQEIITLDFEVKPRKPSPPFWGQIGRNRPNGFQAKPLTNRHSGFEAKLLINRRPWFWGSTIKPTFIVSVCTV
jgi:hypothetical protein